MVKNLYWLLPLSLWKGALEGIGRVFGWESTEQLLRVFVAIIRCVIEFQYDLMTKGRAFKTTIVTQKSEPKMEITRNKHSKIITF